MVKMRSDLFVLALVMGLGVTLALGLLSPLPENLLAPKNTLSTKATLPLTIEDEGLGNDAQDSALTHATVMAKVQISNNGQSRGNLVLHLALEKSDGQIVKESRMLVNVLPQKTDTLVVSVVTKERGDLRLTAEVAGQGNTSTDSVSVRISRIDSVA